MKNKTVREIALELLIRIEKQGGYSHLLISDAIDKEKINDKDESLLTELVYGTIERNITLDFFMEDYIKKQKKIQDWVKILLRMSVYQMAFLDKIPPFAIINEAVNIAKKRGHKGIASFVNGVLRNMARHGLKTIEKIQDPIKRLSIETSHPEWLIQRWTAYYDLDVTSAICRENISRKPVSVRVNRLKTDKKTVIQKLATAGMETSTLPLIEEAVRINKGNALKTDMVQTGEMTIQDISSMLAAKAVETEPGMRVLDSCSAPGGKATFLGEAMENTGEIYAYDLHKSKINLIKKNAKRLGVTTIQTKVQDARHLQEIHAHETFDRILVDAPCSGFGVIRSKPDIKYQKTEKDIVQLTNIQREILDEVAPLVKTTGKIVYSTCTIEKEENEWQVKAFLERHKQFAVDPSFLHDVKQWDKGHVSLFGIQLFPQSFHSDGFFITRLVRLPL